MLANVKRPPLERASAEKKTQEHQQYSPSDRLLTRLAAVKTTGPGRWIARCPAHPDKHPSLSLRETADGTLLMKCWTGCGAADVVAALGLELRDLFPPQPDRRPLRPGERWVPADVLRCLAREALVVLLAAQDVLRGRALGRADLERLALAARRFRVAAKEVGYDGG